MPVPRTGRSLARAWSVGALEVLEQQQTLGAVALQRREVVGRARGPVQRLGERLEAVVLRGGLSREPVRLPVEAVPLEAVLRDLGARRPHPVRRDRVAVVLL